MQIRPSFPSPKPIAISGQGMDTGKEIGQEIRPSRDGGRGQKEAGEEGEGEG